MESRPCPIDTACSSDSAWQATRSAYWQPSDHFILSLGGVAYEDEAVPTGSLLSMGFDFAQLDVGWREHWLSPFSHSAMIISTEAQTLPSITLSNYRRSRAGTAVRGVPGRDGASLTASASRTVSPPAIRVWQDCVSPSSRSGWSLSANRMMQFGGGERGGDSFGYFLDALFKPHQNDNRSDDQPEQEFGNQVAAWTSRFIFPGWTPFAAYLEYAGEDNSYEGNFRLGNASLSMGLTFPRLWNRFDLTYEASEWQNAWYAHGIYLDGLTEDGPRPRTLGRRCARARGRRGCPDAHAAHRLGACASAV